MTEQMLSVPTPDGDMGAYVRRPDGDGPFPVIVYFHHGPGLDEGSKESMQLLADAGYYVVSPDRYHREGPWLSFDPKVMRSGTPEGDKVREKMFGILMGTTDDMVERDLTALLAALEKEPAARKAPMGVIGFCIGARSVLRTIGNHPDMFTAGVALHPSFCTTPTTTLRISWSTATTATSTWASARKTRCSRPTRTSRSSTRRTT